MSLVRRALPIALVTACVLAVVAPAQAAVKPKPKPAVPLAPTGLHGFTLRADEPVVDSFARTPSFAWKPVSGAIKYEFELATSARFTESSIVWSGSVTGTPAVAVPVALPWMTGNPYALYAHVRTIGPTGTSPWSDAFGFNMRAPDAPLQAPSYPGLVRWSTVDGATSYQVWWTDLPGGGKQISTLNNSADEREIYTFHQFGTWPGLVHWRGRAVRTVYGSIPSGLPAVVYGPWSPTYSSYNPPFDVGPVNLDSTVSETVDANLDSARPHTHTPAFLYSGTDTLGFDESEFYRVYVATDKDCVNVVFTGAIVGSPAYSPRTSGTLFLPHDAAGFTKARQGYLANGTEGTTQLADLTPTTSSEAAASSSSSSSSSSSGGSGSSGSGGAAADPTSGGEASGFTMPDASPHVDLWDSGWPTGRYYWTVVSVDLVGDGNGGFVYRDAELPQEACAAGRISSFGKESDPVTIADQATSAYAAYTPFVSGLSTGGRVVSAVDSKPTFYGTPLVAWKPALGAAGYEVQWSKQLYPWKAEGASVYTYGTSALLQDSSGKPLAPGKWYYRVRGLDPYLPSTSKVMSWSDPVQVTVATPKFTVVGAPKSKSGGSGSKKSTRTWIEPGFSVGLPADWRGVTHDTLTAELKAHPLLGRSINKLLLNDLKKGGSAPTRFLGYDPTDLATGMYVSVFKLGLHTHAQWVATLETAIRQDKSASNLRCAEARVPAGKTLRCTYVRKLGDYVESEVVYFFDRSSSTYNLHFSCPQRVSATKASLFAAAATSFRISS